MREFDLEVRPFFFPWLLCSGALSSHQRLMFYAGAGSILSLSTALGSVCGCCLLEMLLGHGQVWGESSVL